MNQKTEKILLSIAFIFCLAIRLAYIDQKNLWFDEVFSWHLSMDSFYTIIVRTANDIHPPLYYFVLKIWNFLAGDSVFSMRLLSALFTSCSVFFIYPVSRKIMEPQQAFFVILLYAVSPLNLYYSQEVRMSAMNLFLNIGSVYFLLKLTDSRHDYHRIFKDKYSVWYIIFSTAAVYTHYFSFFILTAELIFIVTVNRKDTKQILPYLYLFGAMFLIYLIWIPDLITHMSRGQAWRTPQNLIAVLNEYVYYFRDCNLGLYYYYTDFRIVEYLTYCAGFIFVIAVIGLFIRFKNEYNSTTLLITLTFIIPLVLAGIISLRQKIEFYRYLSILVPYLSIIMVYGLFKWKFKPVVYAMLIIFMGINVYGVTIHYSFNFKNDDYRELIGQLSSETRSSDRIYVEPHYYGWAIDYYKKQESLKIPNTVYIRYGWNEIMDSISVQKPERFWLVLDYGVPDTSQYHSYINDLNTKFNQELKITFPVTPEKVELYRFINK